MVEKIVEDFHKAEEEYRNLSHFENKEDFLKRLWDVHRQIDRKSLPGSIQNGFTESAKFGELMPESAYLIEWMSDDHGELVSDFVCDKLSDKEKDEFNKLAIEWFDQIKEQRKILKAA